MYFIAIHVFIRRTTPIIEVFSQKRQHHGQQPVALPSFSSLNSSNDINITNTSSSGVLLHYNDSSSDGLEMSAIRNINIDESINNSSIAMMNSNSSTTMTGNSNNNIIGNSDNNSNTIYMENRNNSQQQINQPPYQSSWLLLLRAALPSRLFNSFINLSSQNHQHHHRVPTTTTTILTTSSSAAVITPHDAARQYDDDGDEEIDLTPLLTAIAGNRTTATATTTTNMASVAPGHVYRTAAEVMAARGQQRGSNRTAAASLNNNGFGIPLRDLGMGGDWALLAAEAEESVTAALLESKSGEPGDGENRSDDNVYDDIEATGEENYHQRQRQRPSNRPTYQNIRGNQRQAANFRTSSESMAVETARRFAAAKQYLLTGNELRLIALNNPDYEDEDEVGQQVMFGLCYNNGNDNTTAIAQQPAATIRNVNNNLNNNNVNRSSIITAAGNGDGSYSIGNNNNNILRSLYDSRYSGRSSVIPAG